MREIKFRVWDKVANKWLDYDDVYFDQEGEVYLIEERNWAYQSYMHKDNITEKVEVVRFTGLKDKNGKEIYEGDILKEPAMYETPENTTPTYNYFEVTFDNCSFQSGGIPMIEDIDWISEESEVVGNVYENKELLKGADKK